MIKENIIDIDLTEDKVDILNIKIAEEKFIKIRIDLFLASKMLQRTQKYISEIAKEEDIELLTLYSSVGAEEMYEDEQADFYDLMLRAQNKLEDELKTSDEWVRLATIEGKEYLSELDSNGLYRIGKIISKKVEEMGFNNL